MDPSQLEGLPRLVFDVALALFKPLFAFNQYDSFLYWPFLVAALVLAVLVFLLHRDDGARNFFQRYFSRAIWGHVSAKADYKFYYINGVLFPVIFAPLILSGAWLSTQINGGLSAIFGDSPGHAAGVGTMALYTVVFFLAYDFGRYLAHFVQHRFDILWHFHKVHHSAEVLTPFTSFRVHPIDLILMASFPAATAGVVDGTFVYDATGSATLQAMFDGQSASDTFTYTVSDGNGGFDTATVTVTVQGVTDLPIAVDDSFVIDEDETIVIDVLANDIGPDGQHILRRR